MAQDIIAVLTTDHREVEGIFAKLEIGEGDRHQLVSKMVEELSKHDAMEKELLYPVVESDVPGGQSMGQAAIAEHEHVVDVLHRIDKSKDLASPQAQADLSTLMREVRHHVQEEEGQIFPALRAAVNEEDLIEMGEKVELAKKAAPTHPHPHAPTSSVGVRAAGPVAATMDKVRDALSRDKP